MTRDEAVIEIQNLLGFTTILQEPIQRELRWAQDRLENGPIRPWFLKEDRAFTFTVAGESRILLPEGALEFLDEDEDSALWYAPDSGAPDQEIIKEDLDFLIKNQANFAGVDEDEVVEQGVPQFYALSGNYFRLFPTPDAIYKIRMIYFKKDTPLTANIENKWLKYAPWLLIGEAGSVLSVSARDKVAQAEFARLRSTGAITLNTQTEARLHANRNYVMGDGAL
jgi:hypothetical protein